MHFYVKGFDKYVFQVFTFCFFGSLFWKYYFLFCVWEKEQISVFDVLADLIESLPYSPRNL